jgi:gamma-glutamyltranspeptidase / glutathione hydrolase
VDFYYNRKREFKSYAQRSVAMGNSGMVASSQPLATLSGYKILAHGGNAVDAAVSMVSMLNVVEPHSAGLGGDAFALIYLAEENKIVGMNGSGRSPGRADISFFHEKGMREMPSLGMLPVTVPGALHGWAEANAKYGKLSLSELFEDAIHYAEHGFPVTEVIAGEWKNAEDVLLSQENSARSYLINGKAPKPGQVFRNHELAQSYKKIARDGIDVFYGGEIGEAIVAFSQVHQGLLAREDFVHHATTWVEPIASTYRGYTIYELPPNGQGVTALEMLNILEGYDMAGLGHNSPHYLHLLLEAKKIAFSDRDSFITDPAFEPIPLDILLSKEYAQQCRMKIDPDKATIRSGPFMGPKKSDTVYVSAVDQEGNAVSLITSIFTHFGSGMVVDKTGIVLQNRGFSFSLDPEHPNCLEPNKRPMHTIIPGMVFKDGNFLMSFGVMGGDFQPQGHTQLLMNLIDGHMNLQEAIDAPRISHIEGNEIFMEGGFAEKTAVALEKKGHEVIRDNRPVNQVGGGQAIYRDPDETVLLGASDRRKDGCAIGY